MADAVVVLGGARTPFGAYGGSLKDLSATDLGVHAVRGALEKAGVPAERIDNVVLGNVVQQDGQAAYMARHVALKAGIGQQVPALMVNRLCGSGLQAVISAAQSILLGESAWAVAGGTESMSGAPHVVKARFGTPLGAAPMADALWQALTDSYCGCPMAETAERLMQRYGITRADADQVAHESQRRTAAAWAEGRMAPEVVPVEVPGRKGPVRVERDEHPRPDTTPEILAKLRPAFRADGTVTGGNASGIVDGAAALVLAGEAEARAAGLRPLARLVSWGYVGVEPQIMGIGPAPASRLALERAGLGVADVDLWEINEAFAGQVAAVRKELGVDPDRLNVGGGAVAIGHPLGASGARLALTLCMELERRQGRYGVAALCIGGGQGIAAVFERLER